MGKFDEELMKVKNASIKKVCDYLKTREDIKLNLEKENKSIDEMWEYIKSEARKQAENGCACIEDDQVYGWAVHYYDEDDIKVESFKNVDKKKLDNIPVNTISHKKVTQPKKAKKEKVPDNQISLFDFLG